MRRLLQQLHPLILLPLAAIGIVAWCFSPPSFEGMFVAVAILTAVGTGLIIWIFQSKLRQLAERWQIVTIAIVTCVSAIACIQLYLVRDQCFVFPRATGRYATAPPIFFPLKLSGNARTQEERLKSREEMIERLSPNGVTSLLQQMPDYAIAIRLTLITLIILLMVMTSGIASWLALIMILIRSGLSSSSGSSKQNSFPAPDLNLQTRRFSVAITYARENQTLVREVARHLAEALTQEQIFFDEFYSGELSRPNLDVYLQDIYRNDSHLIVVFLCGEYKEKEWCGLEWRAVRDLIKKRRDNEIMFVRVGDGDIEGEGYLSIDGYLDARQLSAHETALEILSRFEANMKKRRSSVAPAAS